MRVYLSVIEGGSGSGSSSLDLEEESSMYHSNSHRHGMSGGGGLRWALIGVFCLVTIFSYYKYSDASTRALDSDAAAARAQQQADSLAAQLQVVYEHKSRLERSLKEEQSTCKQAKEDLETTLSELKTNSEKQKSQLEESESLTAELRKQINSLKDTNLDTVNKDHDQLEKLQNQVTSYSDQVSSLQAEVEELKAANEALEANNAASQGEKRDDPVQDSKTTRYKGLKREPIVAGEEAMPASDTVSTTEGRGSEAGEAPKAQEKIHTQPPQVPIPMGEQAQEAHEERGKEAQLGEGGGAIPPPGEGKNPIDKLKEGDRDNEILQRPGEVEKVADGEEVMVNRRSEAANADIVFERNQGEADAGAEGALSGDAVHGILRREENGAENADAMMGPQAPIHPRDVRRKAVKADNDFQPVEEDDIGPELPLFPRHRQTGMERREERNLLF